MQLAATAVQRGAIVCSSNLGYFCSHRVPCCSSLACSCGMSMRCSALNSYKVFQPAMMILSQNRSIVEITSALWKGLFSFLNGRIYLPSPQFSEWFPFLSKTLQDRNSHQPGTVQTSSSGKDHHYNRTVCTGESSGIDTQGRSNEKQIQ